VRPLFAIRGSQAAELAKAALIVALALAVLASCRTVDDYGSGPGSLAEDWEAITTLGQPAPPRTDFVLPDAVLLCGEAVPLERPAVRESLEYEFLLAVNHQAQVELWRRRARRHFPTIEAALRRAGLPDDLKYLAVAESDLRPGVSSPAGASGLWQFMPATARRFGLAVNKEQDQRLLPEPILAAGLSYLAALKNRFGSWSLAMAAYNAGEARVGKAVSQQGASDYYELDLPAETSRYIYRIAAIKLILEGAGSYGFTGEPPAPLYRPEGYEEASLTFPEPVTWAALARQFQCDYKTLRLLNPHLAARNPLKGGPYLVRLPRGAKRVLGT
jgi:hypothetical protein